MPQGGENNQSIPIYTGNSLIVTSLDNYVIALDPANGKEKWRTKLDSPVGKRGITYLKFKNENIIFVPTSKGIRAINEINGSIFNKIGKNGTFGNTLSLLPPIIDGNNIYVANLKKIESFSIKNSKLNWSFNLEEARVWSGFSFDKRTKSLIVVTSNLINLIGNTNKEPDYSNSIIIIDSISGKIKCQFKTVLHDHWDLDAVGNPIVINNNNGKNLIIGFSKTGNIYFINSDTCDYEFKDSFINIQTKISTEYNQTYSSYQKKFIKPKQLIDLKYNLEEYLASLKEEENKKYIKHITRNSIYGDDYMPLIIDEDVIMYGLHGGPEWQGGSYDKYNSQIIIPVNNYPWILRTLYYDKFYDFGKRLEAYLNRKILPMKNKIFSNQKKTFNEKKIYSAPWENDNNFNKIDSLYNRIHYLIDKQGHNIYETKCQRCHGPSRQGFYEDEGSGDTYIPSLVGITFQKKNKSLRNLEEFKKSHSYVGSQIEVTDNELKILSKYFGKYDNILKKTKLLDVTAKWQLLLDKNKLPASIPPWGKIIAINIYDGSINWEINSGYRQSQGEKISGDMIFGGVLSTGGNIFFATGTPDKKIRAYSSNNANELWSSELPVAGSSAPMTYSHNGKQYIIVNSTGGRFFGFSKEMGNFILAYSLK